jgi:hypothetical protein
MNIELIPLQEHEKETFIGIITVRQKGRIGRKYFQSCARLPYIKLFCILIT